MDSQQMGKVKWVSYIMAAALVYIVIQILLDAVVGAVPAWGRYLSSDLVKHGVPLVAGALCLGILAFHQDINSWAESVLYEVSKIVWPTKQDTVSLTISVTIMLLISGVLIAAMDFLSGSVIKSILTL